METEGQNQFCSICLITGSRLFLFNKSEHQSFIKNVIKHSGYDPLPHGIEYICFECKALLVKSYNFVQQALTAQHILAELMKETNTIPFELIKVIDRHDFNYNLLTIHKKDIDFYFTEGQDDFHSAIINVKVEIDDDDNEYDNMVQTNQNEDNIKISPIFFSNNAIEYTESIEYPKNVVKRERKRKMKKPVKRVTANKTAEAKIPVKKRKTVLEPSVFMQSIGSITGKRVRNKRRYDNMELNAELNDYEYKPRRASVSTDSGSVDLYTESGRRLKREHDVRTYPTQCEECPMEIANRKKHHYHYMEEHPNIPYPYRNTKAKSLLCQACGKTYSTNYRYRMHLLTHEANKKETCDKCGKKFSTRIQLLKHIKRHNDNIKHECDYCKKMFMTRSELKTHVRIHTGERPFKCHICGAGFAHKGNVGVHIRSKHQQLPTIPTEGNKQNKLKRGNKLKKSITDSKDTEHNKDTNDNKDTEAIKDAEDIKEYNIVDTPSTSNCEPAYYDLNDCGQNWS